MDQNTCCAQYIRPLLKPALVVTFPKKVATTTSSKDCESDMLQLKVEEYYMLSFSNNLTLAGV